MVTAATKLKDSCPLEEKDDKPRQCIKKQINHFVDKHHCSKSCGFSSSNVCIWEFDHKEGWALKNWCFWTAVLEKTLGNPFNSKEIKPVNSKGNQLWIFIGRTDYSLEKTLMLGKIEGWRRRGRQRMRCLDIISDSIDMSLANSLILKEILKDRQAWSVAVHGVAKSWTWLSHWTTTHYYDVNYCHFGNFLEFHLWSLQAFKDRVYFLSKPIINSFIQNICWLFSTGCSSIFRLFSEGIAADQHRKCIYCQIS